MNILTKIFKKIFALFMSLLSAISIRVPSKPVEVDNTAEKTSYPYVYVHGFFGWGEEDKANDTLPYWGLSTGDDIEAFNKSGFTCAAASVDPVGSAWDRACELYAQIFGTVVDYGAAHSAKFGHDRYGKDYTGKALVKNVSAKDKINIVCHSFGGPTCAMFASIMEYGSAEELAATKDGTISPFFTGGKGDYIYSITGIAGAYNGTTLCIAGEKIEKLLGGSTANGDNALYDMNPDNSVEMNKAIKTVDSIYYFTVPCCSSVELKNGVSIPGTHTDLTFVVPAVIISAIHTVTEGGIVIDDSWQLNDGVVNTISEIGPFNAEMNYVGKDPGLALAETGFKKGVYNVFNTYEGSHMAVLGNIVVPDRNGKTYLVDLMTMINAL